MHIIGAGGGGADKLGITLLYTETKKARGTGKLIIGGGGQIFIYSCSQTVKTITFKGNKLCRT